MSVDLASTVECTILRHMRTSLRESLGISICAVMLSMGCGGDDDGDGDGKGGGAGSAGAAGKAGGGSAGSEAQAGATAAGGDAGGAGGGEQSGPLVPLIAGHESKFAFTPIDEAKPMTGTCDDPTALVEGPKTIGGIAGVLYHSPCAARPYLLQGSGDMLLAAVVQEDGTLKMPGSEYIHSPVEDGSSWLVDGKARTWNSVVDTITTPAGDFEASSCWEMRSGTTLSLLYCRGVGLVQIIDVDNNTALKLSSKNY